MEQRLTTFQYWRGRSSHTRCTFCLSAVEKQRFCSSPRRSRRVILDPASDVSKGVPWIMLSQSHLFQIVETPHLKHSFSRKRAAKVSFCRHKALKLCEACEWGEAPGHTAMCRQANVACLGTLTTVWSLARNSAYLNCSTPEYFRTCTDLTLVVCLTNVVRNALVECLHYHTK